ncbi:tetratricopeptide repeat protein, partial [Actinomyces sp. oral taxon 171]|uniref:tetratricopeptide repeat protein n=1 Tax=Actinomyces sp. oral taxon 171 TaxID=706438 RepID=UPI001E6065FB
MSIVRLLGAKSTPTPFLDRAGALARLETWARSEERFAIHILGGDGGSGKTRLGVELCRRLTTPNAHHRGTEVWQAGFLQNIEQSDSTSTSDDASSLLLVVDYAEARPETVTEVINIALRAAEDPARQRVRITFLVRRPSPLSVTHRSSNEWLDALRPQESKDEGLNRVLDEASTIILNDEELSDTERKDLFTHAYRAFTCSPESTPSPELTGRLSDPVYSQPLLVTVDAFLNAHPLPNPQISCSPSELFEEVLLHEEHYWVEHWPQSLAVNTDRERQNDGAATPIDAQDEKRRSLNRELARQAVAAATLADIQDEEDAISLLRLLPATPDKNTDDLAKWLRDCYPPPTNGNGHSTLWCKNLEPDRIGEHLIVSEADDLVPLLQELLSPSRVGTSSLRTWTVLERISTDPHLDGHVGRILNDVLAEVTQAVHTETVNSQSPDLAAGFAKLINAVRPHIDPNKAHEAQQTLSDSGYFTALLEYELAQCSANILPPTDDSSEIDRATYASRRLSLSRCLANIGRHDEALKAVREATKLYRTLAKHNPGTYTPNLASSLNNLAGSQAENGQPHDALQTVHEATNLYRTL